MVCAAGPRGLELGGELGDAVICEAGLGADQVETARAAVATGARRAGRSPADIQMWWYARTSIGETEDEALDQALSSIAAAGAFLARADPGLADVPEHLRHGLRTLGERYDMAAHLRTDLENPNRRLVDDDRLRTFLIERTGIVGDPSAWRSRLVALADLGVENLLCVGAGGDKARFIDLVGREVIAPISRPRRRVGQVRAA